jgi:hypothetical protein
MANRIKIVLVLLLFIPSLLGIFIQKHYCHGQLMFTIINSASDNCCNKCKSCESKTFSIKIKSDFLSGSVQKQVVPEKTILPAGFPVSLQTIPYFSNSILFFRAKSPPGVPINDLPFICVFRC